MQRILRTRLFIEEPNLFRAHIILWDGSEWVGWGASPLEAEANTSLLFWDLDPRNLRQYTTHNLTPLESLF